MKVLIHDNWGEIGLPRRARICGWVKGIITRGTPSFWYIRSTENLEENSGNKQGARCSKSLCSVQAEQGAAAQAVDAFQVEGGSSCRKCSQWSELFKELDQLKDWDVLFLRELSSLIFLFQLILVACDRPNLEGWDHFTRSWHWCQWGVGAVNWNVCVVPVSFESNCEKADRQLLLESESSDKLAGPAWKSKNYHLACLGLSCSWPRVVCYCYGAVLFRYFWLLASIILWSILITWNPCAEFGWEFYGATWSHRDRADQQDGT